MLGSTTWAFFKRSNPEMIFPLIPRCNGNRFTNISRAYATSVADFGIIGAGTAGMVASLQAFSSGYSVALFDKRLTSGSIQAISKTPKHFLLRDDQNMQHEALKVIIATGVSFQKLQTPGAEQFYNKGIYYAFADAKAKETVEIDTPVVIYGAGNTAGEASLYYESLGARVTLIFNQSDLTKTMSKSLFFRIVASKIERMSSSVIYNMGGDKKISFVDVKNTNRNIDRRILTSFLLALNDPIPNPLPTIDFDDMALDQLGYVRIKGYQRNRVSFATNIPDIYAIGDSVTLGTGQPLLASPQGVAVISEASLGLVPSAIPSLKS